MLVNGWAGRLYERPVGTAHEYWDSKSGPNYKRMSLKQTAI